MFYFRVFKEALMANRDLQTQATHSFWSIRNFAIAAGALVVAPYVLNRLFRLANRGLGNVTANDVALAGKDGVRDAADDLNVGGVSGTLKRAAGRVSDHLRTDI
jgi:hypothetical protein